MNTLRNTLLFLGALWLVACETERPVEQKSNNQEACEDVETVGDTIPLKADSSLDTTIELVWANRANEGAPLTAEEHVQACIVLAACVSDSSEANTDLSVCITPAAGFFWEERATLTPGTMDRWAYDAREILKFDGDCSKVKAFIDESSSQYAPDCEEAGCTKACVAPKSVSCEGNVATFTDYQGVKQTRDCSRSLTKCDADSPTGCTDRVPVPCEHPAKDTCYDNIRLGCDGTGKVSFHDCARTPGGSCETDITGLGQCVVDNAGECDDGQVGCLNDTVTACFAGKKYLIACNSLGLGGCDSTGVCKAK